MFFDFIEKIPELLRFTWQELAKVLIGAFLVGFLAVKWVKAIKRATKAQIEAEQHKLTALLAERAADYQQKLSEATAAYHEKISDLHVKNSDEKLSLERDKLALQESSRETAAERDRLQGELSKLQRQWADLEAFDGKLWQRENAFAPPTFVARSNRKARFLTIMNLKGGVGKTTLTANVGVALATKGHKVLLVDLDFQGSLTRLCLSSADIKHTIAKGLLSSRLLEVAADSPPISPHELAQRVTAWGFAPNSCLDLILKA